MASEILSVGTAPAQSTDQVIGEGKIAKILLKPAPDLVLGEYARVAVELKTSGGSWVSVGHLTSKMGERAYDIVGPATFRVNRDTVNHACGVDLA